MPLFNQIFPLCGWVCGFVVTVVADNGLVVVVVAVRGAGIGVGDLLLVETSALLIVRVVG